MRTDPLAFLATELDALKQQGLYRKLRVLEGRPEAHTTYDHTSVVNLSSNNYLGLTTHPKLVKAAVEAVEKFGVGSGAVRTISGTMDMHMELERRLAAFKHVESVVVFQSGFAANAGTVAAVLTKDDVIISDELNHASIIDGCRLSKAPIKVFPHKDVAAARTIMEGLPKAQKKILITDGVFSMDGDLAPVGDLLAVCRAHDAWLMVDDAHGLGVVNGGRGAAHGHDVPLRMGTLSKALGSYGGYVCASAPVVDYLKTRARTFVYSTGLPPASVAAALAALDIIESEPARVAEPLRKARLFTGLMGLPEAQSCIAPVIVGDARRALAISARLEEMGSLVGAIRPPTVPPGTSRLRVTFSAAHGDDDVTALAAAMREALEAEGA